MVIDLLGGPMQVLGGRLKRLVPPLVALPCTELLGVRAGELGKGQGQPGHSVLTEISVRFNRFIESSVFRK